MKIEEGYMPFLGYRTYYRIVGTASKDKLPLLLLHGGPGSTHNYFEVLDRVAEETGRQVISYDQIGCGNSYLDGHPELWTQDTWMNELIALREYLHLERLHILGQSWAGSRWELMEGARHMCFVDRHEDYCRILESWLEEHDSASSRK